MTDEVKIEIRRPKSIWRARGVPVSSDGMCGALRTVLLILEMTAESGDVADEFIAECSRADEFEYEHGRVEVIEYIGWVWVTFE